MVVNQPYWPLNRLCIHLIPSSHDPFPELWARLPDPAIVMVALCYVPSGSVSVCLFVCGFCVCVGVYFPLGLSSWVGWRQLQWLIGQSP